MFSETNNGAQKRGWIEVICGSMFSGKTEELIRRLKRAELAKQKIEIYKADVDKRYHDIKIVSHQGSEISAVPVSASGQILERTAAPELIGIDEAQFFDMDLPGVCSELANRGTRVIVAGLDLDYSGKPFGPMPHLLALAEYVSKVHAICMSCGNLAYVSHRKVKHDQLVLLGETDHYEPLCRSCFNRNFAG